MRVALLPLIFALLGLTALTTDAHAYWTSEVSAGKAAHSANQYWDRPVTYQTNSYQRRSIGRAGGGHVSGICWTAARMGGPCGCEASRIAFGQPIRDLWLVSNWFRFPRTSAHVGAAAIWGRHHVEIVIAVNNDGTVDTAGSVGFSHVPIRRLTFVEPSIARRHYAGEI